MKRDLWLWAVATSALIGSCLVHQEAQQAERENALMRSNILWLEAKMREQQDDIDALRRKVR